MNTSIVSDMNDPEFRKLLSQEELILEVTETICKLLEKEKISRKELADRLGKSKGFVSQLLNGGRNLTLRSVADIINVLGYKVSLKPEKLEIHRRANNVFEFPKYQTPIGSKYINDPELIYYKPDNYPNIQKAIS